MNKTAIKNFAVWARVQLIEAAKQRAYEYEITDGGENKANLDAVGGRLLTKDEKKQRRQLVDAVSQKGFTQVMEAAAYTWFNRFIALRFMEVNGYLPSKTRVFTDENGAFKPEILKDAAGIELEGLDRNKVFDLLERQDNEALYKYLLITQCNALNACLPYMFEKIATWTELLFPGNLLKADSVLGRMVADIPEEDWTDQVQILGWLYQYYISERHDEIVNIYKGTIKKDDIPAATQLFTTDWVVRYMVDNSLGRYWIERHPESSLGEKLEFFVCPKSGTINYVNENVTPQELTFFDPCMGSGHILVYAFDVLMEIYKECGYSERDAAVEIVQNNLYGLDIDDRCSQLAYFAVMMKARSHDRRFLNRKIEPHVMAIQESNTLHGLARAYMSDRKQNLIGEYLIEQFKDAKEIGSLKTAKAEDYHEFLAYLQQCAENAQPDMEFSLWNAEERPYIEYLAKQADILSKKYAVVCTNPPYMNKLEGNLKTFVTKEFKDYSGDLFSVFIFHNFAFCKDKGYSGFMTPFVWMFIKTYENLRNYILAEKALTTLVQMEYSAFEEATVPICSFVLQNCISSNKSLCFRLSDFKGGMEVQREKVLQAIADPGCGYFYEADQANFSKIPGSPVAYWVGENFVSTFEKGISIDEISDFTGSQHKTADNEKFLRNIWEVDSASVARGNWIFYIKGGEYRKWYGNIDLFVNWTSEAKNFYMNNSTSNMIKEKYWFQEGITYTSLSSFANGFRYLPPIGIFDIKGPSIISLKNMLYCLGFFNSIVAHQFFKLLNPTITLQVKDVKNTPLIIREESTEKVSILSKNNVDMSKADWDSCETSWDFKRNPLV